VTRVLMDKLNVSSIEGCLLIHVDDLNQKF